MTMDPFTHVDRIFGESRYFRRADNITDINAQIAVESGTHFRAAADRKPQLVLIIGGKAN